MGYDGSINFDSKIDTKGFDSGMSDIESKASAGFSKVGGIAKTGLSILGGALAGVTAAMGAGIAAGVKYNATMESYMANFETMLGSADKADKLLGQLKEMGAKTPFELGDLADASKTLLAFGTDVNDLEGNLQMLGDISLGNADKFKSLSLTFGQVQSQGKLMGGDLLQMINAGFNPLQEISERTGESMESLKDKMSKGQISFDMVAESMKNATAEGGQFYQAMDKSSKTFEGMVSTMKDNANALLGEVTKGISEGFTKELIPSAIGMIDQLNKAYEDGGLDGLITAFGEVLSQVVTMLGEYTPILLETAQSMIWAFVGGLVDSAYNSSGMMAEIGTALIGTLGDFAEALFFLGMSLLDGLLSGMVQSMPKLMSELTSNLEMMLETVLMLAPAMLQNGMTLIAQLINGIAQALPMLIQYAISIITELDKAFYGNIGVIIESGLNLILGLIEGITTAIPLLIEAMPEVLLAFVQAIIDNLPMIAEAGLKIIFALLEAIILSLIELAKVGIKIISYIRDRFKDQSVLEAILSIGTDIVKGLWQGIQNAWSWLVDKVGGLIGELVSSIKSSLGIHSPSRVFAEIGKYSALGMGVGFEDSMITTADMMNESVMAALGRLKTSVEAQASIVGNAGVVYNNSIERTTNENVIMTEGITEAIQDGLEGATVQIDSRDIGRIVVLRS